MEFFGTFADARRAQNQADILGDDQSAHGFFGFLAGVALDLPRYPTGFRVVRHRHQIASRQTNERCERGPFVAPFVFFHLNDELLAFFQRLADIDSAALRPCFLAKKMP